MAGLASDLESDAVGGSVLELEGGGRQVVKVLVKELQEKEMLAMCSLRKYHGIGSSC